MQDDIFNDLEKWDKLSNEALWNFERNIMMSKEIEILAKDILALKEDERKEAINYLYFLLQLKQEEQKIKEEFDISIKKCFDQLRNFYNEKQKILRVTTKSEDKKCPEVKKK